VSPEIIRPFYKSGPRKKGGKNKHGKSRILTNTPKKIEIENQTVKEKI
jgi:hypothetical protein